MDANKKLFARKLFRLCVHEAKGIEYQRLFEKVMQYCHKGFVPIRPYGNIGDRKNDGYIPESGTYYQVYAPDDPAQRVTAAARKATKDFEGLIEHWDQSTPVREYRFVFNDCYRGSPPPLEDALGKIRRNHQVKASVFLAKDLEAEALELAEDQLSDILNTPIPESGLLPSVDFGVLRDVVNHVLQVKTTHSLALVLEAPDFDEKIHFNGLTRGVASLLTYASFQIEAVTDYFSKNSTFARQELRDQLARMYADSRIRLGRQGVEPEDLGDTVFFDMLARMTPPGVAPTEPVASQAQDAAAVVMAFYFEACDIFEDPNATTE